MTAPPVTAGLVMHVDARDAAGPFTTWTDRSASANDLTVVGATLQATGGPLGQQVVKFDGVDDYTYATPFTLTQPVSVVLLVRMDGLGSDQPMLRHYEGDDSFMYALRGGNAGRTYIHSGVKQWQDLDSSLNPEVGDWHIWSARYNSPSCAAWRDGVDGGLTGDAGPNDLNGIQIGAGSPPLNGAIATALVYDASLTDEEFRSVEGWVESEWLSTGPVGPFLRTASGGFLRTASGILRPA